MIVLAMIVAAPSVDARNLMSATPGKSKVGIRAGVLAAGTFKLQDTTTVTTRSGAYGGVWFDLALGSRMFVAIDADVGNFDVYGRARWFVAGFAGVKFRLNNPSARLEWRPVAAVGYGNVARLPGTFEPIDLFLLKGGVELLLTPAERRARYQWVLEVVVIAAPSGSSAGRDASFGPTGLFRIGVQL